MKKDKPCAKATYSELQATRDSVLARARAVSRLTIPYLFPPEGHNESSVLYTPWQCHGARCVNHLAAKLTLVTLPPNQPMVRLRPRRKKLETLADDVKALIEEALSNLEQELLAGIERRGDRVVFNEGFKHLIVGGNVLIHHGEKNSRLIDLSRYVIRRDEQGNVLDIVFVEKINVAALKDDKHREIKLKINSKEKTVDVYTHVYFDHEDKKWRDYQEIKEVLVSDSEGEYPMDASPYLALRWHVKSGESYGRSLGEDYLGDFTSFEKLSQGIIKLAGVASRTVLLVKPNGQTDADEINEAEDGDAVPGDPEDVKVLGVDKVADMQIARSVLETIEQRLSYVFLLSSAIQRQAERVTAEEIRFMASELEGSHGGSFSLFSKELQLPYVKLGLAALKKSGDLKTYPEDAIDPVIITGVDALGRNQDVVKLDQFLSMLSKHLGPEQVARVIESSDFASRLAAGLGIDKRGLVKSPEQQQQENAAAQNAQLLQTAVAPGIREMGQSARQTQSLTAQPQSNG